MTSHNIAAGATELSRPYTDWTARFLPKDVSPHEAVISAAIFGDPNCILALGRAASEIYMTAPELAAGIIGEPLSTNPDELNEGDETESSTVEETEPRSTYIGYDGQEYYTNASQDQIAQLEA